MRIEHDLVKCWLLLILGQVTVEGRNASLIGVSLRHNWKRAKAREYILQTSSENENYP